MALSPSGNVKVNKPPEKQRLTQSAQVVSVSADGKTCVVDNASTQMTCVIPGNIKGVKQGRTVTILVEGNDRRVFDVATAIPAQTYQTAGGTQRTVPSTTVYKPAGNISQVTAARADDLYWGGSYNRYEDINATGLSSGATATMGYIDTDRTYIRELQQWARAVDDSALPNICEAIRTLNARVDQIVNVLNNTVAASNGTAQNAAALEQLRDVTGTLLTDLKEQGITQ